MIKNIKPHLQYASYIIRHKYFVFLSGLRAGAPIWRLIIHDWAKMSRAEWNPYVQMFYGPKLIQWKNKEQEDFDRAWLHHQHKNPHHWQHYLLQEDDGDIKILEIPENFAREMVADWIGVGRAITGKWEVESWYKANYEKIKLHPNTRKLVDNLIDEFRWEKRSD
jgi:hypothetical protein